MAPQDADQIVAPCSDPALLDAAAAVIAESGLAGLTLERLGRQGGVSRMTLHRRNVTVAGVVAGLSVRAGGELIEALFDAMSAPTSAAERLAAALAATFDVADRHLAVLAGLFAADGGVFHGSPGPDGSIPTLEVFIAPFARLIADGALDGSIRPVDDPRETATVLFNTVGWGYVQLRHSQRWPAERAAKGITSLAWSGLAPD